MYWGNAEIGEAGEKIKAGEGVIDFPLFFSFLVFNGEQMEGWRQWGSGYDWH